MLTGTVNHPQRRRPAAARSRDNPRGIHDRRLQRLTRRHSPLPDAATAPKPRHSQPASFQIKQRRAAKRAHAAQAVPTDIVLKGRAFAPSCKRVKGKKRRRTTVVRQVQTTAKGVWRTLSRTSVTTAKHATWLTQDRCDGTLTKVQHGRLSVHDRTRKRNLTVKAGRTYLAQFHAAKPRRGRS